MTDTPDKQVMPPTQTLARLYEEQNQYMDALAAYELLGQTNPEIIVTQRVHDLLARILLDPHVQYDTTIDQIFTPEEKVLFRIAPSALCNTYQSARDQSLLTPAEELDFSEDDEDEAERDGYLASPLPIYREPVEESAPPSETISADEIMKHVLSARENLGLDLTQPERKVFRNMTVMELISQFQRFIGRDTKITDVSIGDLLRFWQSIQNESYEED